MSRTIQRLMICTLLLCGTAACTAAPAGTAAAGTAAQGAVARLIVTGQAEVAAQPDRASFAASISNSGRDADAVLDENATRSERMLAALRAADVNITHLQTRGVRLDPEWSPRPRNADQDWRPEIVGHRASNRIEITTDDLARVGELLATAVEAGANGVDGVRFTLENDADARAEAIRRATRTALDEARTMAQAAGVEPGRVLELRLDHAQTTLPQALLQGRMEMAAMDMASVRAMPVEPGEIRIQVSVTLTLGGA